MAFSKSSALQVVGLGTTIAEIMFRERPGVVQLATVAEGYLGLWLKRFLGLPYVIYAHGNEILGAIQDEWEKPRVALRNADRVFANSRYTKDLVRLAGVNAEKIDIVHPGCDIDLFHPVEPRKDLRRKLLGSREFAHVILTVGNLVGRKGHDMVIRALPRVRQAIPNLVYLVVGDGPYRTHLEHLAAEVGVADHVVFSGRIRDEDLPQIYALSDVFVMPSREQLEKLDVEGFGLVFLEANACGKPVVGGRSGGIPEAIVDGHTGFLVDPQDSDDIALAIIRLLGDQDLTRRMGQAGRLRVVSEFNWSHIAGQVQRILNTVVMENAKTMRPSRILQ